MESRSQLVNVTRQNNALTANGAVTHSTSLSACLDFFFNAGACRHWADHSLIDMFLKARSENRDLAYQILCWARDCRGGAGVKRLYHVVGQFALTHLPQGEWEALALGTPIIGSWKDLFVIESPDASNVDFLVTQLEEHEHANLLAKWFPRKGVWFEAARKYKGMTPKDFRKYLVSKSNTVEQKICAGNISDIDYSTVPSIAMNKYRKLFSEKDSARFEAFNQDVLDGNATVNASVIYPHMLFQAMCEGQDAKAVEAQWLSLPNYMEGSSERILPVCDVSGSMTGLPMDVSVALGMYISERNEGIFRDAFITFSEFPKMQYVQGETLQDKFHSIHTADWGGSTNLQATFDLVLNRAIEESVPQDQMPTKILIISDMEFDYACGNHYGGRKTNLDVIRDKYKASGYVMPELIFWNVNGRLGNVPASMADSKIGLVSGFSPAILTAILQGEVETPYELMMKAVDVPRYKDIVSMIDLCVE